MNTFIVFLRAVNVGGTGKLPMAELKDMCVDAGLHDVKTYIASGNVVCRSGLSAGHVKAVLESRLESYAGKPVGVIVRTPDELQAALDRNPFIENEASRVLTTFLDDPPPQHALDNLKDRKDEEVALGACEIYAYFPSGMGRSKLKVPAAAQGTARNVNTIRRMLVLAAELD